MSVVRFADDVLPVDRDRAVALIRREVEAARRRGLTARLLVSLTRGRGEPALEDGVELSHPRPARPAPQRSAGLGRRHPGLDAGVQRGPGAASGSGGLPHRHRYAMRPPGRAPSKDVPPARTCRREDVGMLSRSGRAGMRRRPPGAR